MLGRTPIAMAVLALLATGCTASYRLGGGGHALAGRAVGGEAVVGGGIGMQTGDGFAIEESLELRAGAQGGGGPPGVVIDPVAGVDLLHEADPGRPGWRLGFRARFHLVAGQEPSARLGPGLALGMLPVVDASSGSRTHLAVELSAFVMTDLEGGRAEWRPVPFVALTLFHEVRASPDFDDIVGGAFERR